MQQNMLRATVFFLALVVVMVLPLLGFGELLAQAPPMLPNAPTQAPIDGGLALLAAAGGAYAWKKLRSKVSG